MALFSSNPEGKFNELRTSLTKEVENFSTKSNDALNIFRKTVNDLVHVNSSIVTKRQQMDEHVAEVQKLQNQLSETLAANTKTIDKINEFLA